MLQPLNGRAILRRHCPEDQTKGGIILPDSAKKKSKSGEVVAVCSSYVNKAGHEIKTNLKVGDVVLFSEWGGDEIVENGETFMIIREEDVLAIQS